MHRHQLFCPLIHLTVFFLCLLKEWFRLSYKGCCPGVYLFDEIFTTDLGFETLLHPPRLIFTIFFIHNRLSDDVCFQNSRVFLIWHLSNGSNAFPIWLFYSLHCLSLPIFHYEYGAFFTAEFYPDILAVFFLSSSPVLFHFLRIPSHHSYHHHHHHHGIPKERISLTLSCHVSLSSIALRSFSMLHPVSLQSCCRLVLDGHPTLARPCEEVHWSTSLMSSPLLLQQCTTCLARLISMVFEMDGKCPYRFSFVGYCLLIMLNTARSILVQLPQAFSPYA